MENLKRKCQVVMLATTNENNPLLFLGNDNKLSKDFRRIPSSMFHLYILSDEEIKEGDWCIETNINSPNYNKPFIAHNEENYINSVRACNNYQSIKKIIASTDKSLNLPEPSQSFIQKYIEEWNKDNKITEVMFEYWCGEQTCNCNSRQQDCFRAKNNLIPKVDKNNQITITKVKDSWSREEVIALHKANCERLTNSYISSDIDWIEENL